MRLTVATMVYKARPDLRENVASMLVGREEAFILVENGCAPLDAEFPEALRVHNQKNVGITRGWQQVLDVCETEILALFHDDVRILDADWAAKVIAAFDADPLLGLVSFFGCPGIMTNGDRTGVFRGTVGGYSNIPNAHLHGMRRTTPRAIAIPDSFSLIYRVSMLREMGGFDMRFSPDHYYDYQLALQFLAAGYHNLYLPIPVSHIGNITRNDADYSQWINKETGMDDYQLMMRNRALLVELWGLCLPLYVNEDFSIQARDPLLGVSAQRNILGYDYGSRFPIRVPVASIQRANDITNTISMKALGGQSGGGTVAPDIVSPPLYDQTHQTVQPNQVSGRWMP